MRSQLRTMQFIRQVPLAGCTGSFTVRCCPPSGSRYCAQLRNVSNICLGRNMRRNCAIDIILDVYNEEELHIMRNCAFIRITWDPLHYWVSMCAIAHKVGVMKVVRTDQRYRCYLWLNTSVRQKPSFRDTLRIRRFPEQAFSFAFSAARNTAAPWRWVPP